MAEYTTGTGAEPETGLAALVGALDRSRLAVVLGHSGSGKSEFAVNLALALATAGKPVTLADLDVVNPYFRPRERRALLEARNVRLLTSSQSCPEADLPALPAELLSLLESESRYSVWDLGGDGTGARILARYRSRLAARPHCVWLLLNTSRPGTADVQRALNMLGEITAAVGLPVTGIVHNTHLCGETTQADLERGAALAETVASAAGLPVICHMVEAGLARRCPMAGRQVFPVELYLCKPWDCTVYPAEKGVNCV